MKTDKYTKRTFLIVLLTIFLGGMCSAQTKEELKGIPINETGISVEEYNSIMKHQVIELDLNENKSFTLELIKVNSNTNDGVRVVEKNNPNKPQWSAIPYTILREEDYDENK
jgi:hypothetical protein